MNEANPPADERAHDAGQSNDQPVTSDGPGGAPPSNRPSGDGPGGPDGSEPPGDESVDTGSRLVRFVEYATFGILCLLALVATFRFYFAASEAIRVWFSSDFVPVFQAAFNLVVLVAAALGISVLVRRIGTD